MSKIEQIITEIEEYIDKVIELDATCNLGREEIIEMINFGMQDE